MKTPVQASVRPAMTTEATNGYANKRALITGGLGFIGSNLARVLLSQGADVTLVDINPARATVASAFGLSFATPAQAQSECGLVVHASASSTGLATALIVAIAVSTAAQAGYIYTTLDPPGSIYSYISPAGGEVGVLNDSGQVVGRNVIG